VAHHPVLDPGGGDSGKSGTGHVITLTGPE